MNTHGQLGDGGCHDGGVGLDGADAGADGAAGPGGIVREALLPPVLTAHAVPARALRELGARDGEREARIREGETEREWVYLPHSLKQMFSTRKH